MGSKGLGYYKDAKLSATTVSAGGPTLPSATAASVTSVVSDENAVDNIVTHNFAFEIQQNKATVSILIQIPMILAGSAKVSFQTNSLDVSFTAMMQEPESKSGEEKDGQLRNYSMSFKLSGSIVTDESKFDVAMQNMVIVLLKAEEKIWSEPCLTKAKKKRVSFSSPSSSSSSSSVLVAKTTNESSGSSAASTTNEVKTKELTNVIDSLKFTSSSAIFDLD